MTEEIIFKTFKTHKYHYLYDRHTNSICRISQKEFDDLNSLEDTSTSATIRKYQSYGLLAKNVVKEIRHPATDNIDYQIKNNLQQIILQVTQQCNLRCSYCAYSGLYSNRREHSCKKMSFELAKKAIDFFIDRTSQRDSIVISFYGGEPLLEFDLIKKCVEYANAKTTGKKVMFGLSTNGTLLKGKIPLFLEQHNFMINISLDGSKKEHDANRKFVSGEGSFDVIMDNVKYINENCPNIKKTLGFLTVVNPKANLGCVLEFFQTNSVLADKNIIFNAVVDNGYKGNLSYDKSFMMIRDYEYLKMLLMLLGKINRKSVSELVLNSSMQYRRLYKNLNRHNILQDIAHHGGPCLPGIARIFVSVEGKLFPCEKIDETSDFFCIGSIEDGVNAEKIKKIMNIGEITKKECIDCWNLQNCMICANQIEFEQDKIPNKANKLKVCKDEKNRVLNDFYELCVLRELGYEGDFAKGEKK